MNNNMTAPNTALELIDDTGVEARGDALKSVTIGLVCGGGIAAIEIPKIARELRRFGASVTCYPTDECLNFIGERSIDWGCENKTKIGFSGLSAHICQEDALLVFPATANLLGKIANGICDDLPTTLLQSAIGQRKCVVFHQTMHESMSDSVFVQENIEKITKQKNFYQINPRRNEGKLKARTPEEICIEFCHRYNVWKRNNKIIRGFVTFGGTHVAIDEVRTLSNLSTGTLGRELVKQLYISGVNLTNLIANTVLPSICYDHVENISAPLFSDFRENFYRILKDNIFTFVVHSAAVSDFEPVRVPKGKIPSSQEMILELKKTEKLRDSEQFKSQKFKVACKITEEFSTDDLLKCKEIFEESKLNAMIWNTTKNGAFGDRQFRGKILCAQSFSENDKGKTFDSKYDLISDLTELLIRSVK